MGYMPVMAREALRAGHSLALKLGVPHMATVAEKNGLYVAVRSKRDPINTNRKRPCMLVLAKRDGKEIFREKVEVKNFPSEQLIAQLMLIL